MKLIHSFIYCLAAICFMSCMSKKQNATENTNENTAETNIPTFNADTAYLVVNSQCEFGPRTLESEAHEKCGQYIIQLFELYGCTVSKQETVFKRYDGKSFKGYNIIACTNPQATNRIVICTHWDSRPWCDQDPDSSQWHKPVIAANDGASGVGIMAELARTIKSNPLPFGVDFVCFDAEDMGTPSWDDKGGDDSDTWCLGSQYWSRNPHSKNISYGILLDMVGGRNAYFYQEGFSKRYAQFIVDKVWNAASGAGFSSYFPNNQGRMITDDHLPMNETANIPTIDIIPYYPNAESAFGPTWHTSHDNMENISAETLRAVGQTLVQLLYTE